jgi:hypothetical protein
MSRQVSWLMGGYKREHREYAICCLDLLYRSCLQPSRRSGQWLGWQATSQLQWRDRAGFSPDFPDALKNPKKQRKQYNDCKRLSRFRTHLRKLYTRAKHGSVARLKAVRTNIISVASISRTFLPKLSLRHADSIYSVGTHMRFRVPHRESS